MIFSGPNEITPHTRLNILKEELSDLKQVIMIYSDQQAQTQISHRGAVQQKLWDLFDLGVAEKDLTIH